MGCVIVLHVCADHILDILVAPLNTSLTLRMAWFAVDQLQPRPLDREFTDDLIHKLSAVVTLKDGWCPKDTEDTHEVTGDLKGSFCL